MSWAARLLGAFLLVSVCAPAPARAKESEAERGRQQAKKNRKRQSGMRVNAGAFRVGKRGVAPMGRQLGVGLQLGYPTSVTAKLMLTGDQAVVGGVGFGAPGVFSPSLTIHADYLWHPHILMRAPPFRASWYIGGGAFVGITDGKARPLFNYVYVGIPNFMIFGARLPIGFQVAMNHLPIEAYVEVTPALAVFPYIGLGASLALGGRYYF